MRFWADYQLGIELIQCAMKAILARRSMRKWHFERYWDVSLPEAMECVDGNDHPWQWSALLQRHFASLPKRHRVNIALSPHEIDHRELRIPKAVADEAVGELIEKLLSQLFPGDPETLYSDFIRIRQGETVWVSVAAKAKVLPYVQSLQEARLKVGSIDSSVYLLRQLAQRLKVDTETLLVHVRETTALVVAPSAYPPFNIVLDNDHRLFSRIKEWMQRENITFSNQIALTGEIASFSRMEVAPVSVACLDPFALFTAASIEGAVLPDERHAFALACGLAVRTADRLWNR